MTETLAPVIPLPVQPRPESRFDREARFLLAEGITSATMRLNAKARPELADWCSGVAVVMDKLAPPS